MAKGDKRKQTIEEYNARLKRIYEAVEVCPHCMSENIYPMHDVEKYGYVAKCNHCGKEIFLCDECMHSNDNKERNCDWCEIECGGKCFRGVTRN